MHPNRAKAQMAIVIGIAVTVVAGAGVMYLRRSSDVPSAGSLDGGGSEAASASQRGAAPSQPGRSLPQPSQHGPADQPSPPSGVAAGTENWAVGVYRDVQARGLQIVGGGWVRTHRASQEVIALNLSLTTDGSQLLFVVDDAGAFIGVPAADRTNWLSVSELRAGLPLRDSVGISLGVGPHGAPQRSVVSGNQRFDVFESEGDVGVSGEASVTSIDETWVDASGKVARRVRFVDITSGGTPVESLIIVTDRMDAAWVPSWGVRRGWTMPSAAVLRRLNRMTAPRNAVHSPAPAIRPVSFAQEIRPAKPLPKPKPPVSPPKDCKRTLSDGRVMTFPCSRIQPPLPPARRRPAGFPEVGDIPPTPPSPPDPRSRAQRFEEVVNCAEDSASGPVGLGVGLLTKSPALIVLGAVITVHGLKRFRDCVNGALGGGHGDPHLYTFDGFRYDLQAIGEFVHLESREFEVQMRFQGTKGSATRILATAVRTPRHVVESYHRNRPRPDDPAIVIIDGASRAVDVGGVTLSDGTYVQQERTGGNGLDAILIVAPDGSYAWIENLAISQNVMTDLAPGGRHQGGLAGTANGIAADDFSLRDGTRLSVADVSTIEGLYGRFAQSWRVQPGRRLFTQGSASEFLTEAYTSVPSAITSLANLDTARVRQARLECEKRGITGERLLEDCTYDVAVMRDERWADQAANSIFANLIARPTAARRRIELAARPAAPAAPVSGVRLQPPSYVTAGSPVEIVWASNDAPRGLIFIASPAMPANQYPLQNAHASANGSPARLVAPASPGRYEIRYFDLAGGTVVSRAELVVADATVVIDAPRTVSAGAVFGFAWRGLGAASDLIFVASVDSPANQYPLENRHATARGPAGRLIAPARPGTYEIRYFSAANGRPLARAPLVVSVPEVRLTAPAEVAAGARLDFSWEGPNAPNDLVFIARPTDPQNEYPLEGRHATSRGASGVLTAPDTPGEYELRYFSYQNGAVLHRQPLRVR
jgi:hypothetical protein